VYFAAHPYTLLYKNNFSYYFLDTLPYEQMKQAVGRYEMKQVTVNNAYHTKLHKRSPLRSSLNPKRVIVGDSPEGPLKQPGESCLKPAKNQS
jgi:hypothetical protein